MTNCSSCKHFTKRDEDGGTCHRYPPQNFVFPDGEQISTWTAVKANWLCGEWASLILKGQGNGSR